MLVNANQIVSTDRIVDELWGEDGVGKQNALWVHVSNLRSALEPERPAPFRGHDPADPGARATCSGSRRRNWTRPNSSGWCPKAAGCCHPTRRRRRWCLPRHWRCGGVGHLRNSRTSRSPRPRSDRLESLRLDAVEGRIEADLARGLSHQLVGELQGLVREHPLREHFTALLMMALYRSQRQAEALRVYGQLRTGSGRSWGSNRRSRFETSKSKSSWGTRASSRSQRRGYPAGPSQDWRSVATNSDRTSARPSFGTVYRGLPACDRPRGRNQGDPTGAGQRSGVYSAGSRQRPT